jgi:outer membrane protein OmpA-like peptidoglycan-associated protein
MIFSFHGCDDMKALLFPYRHDSQFLPMILLVAAFLMLSGCSYVPDALNPVEWYKDATGLLGDEEEEEEEGVKTTRASEEAPDADKDFPKLSSVPDAPPEGKRQKVAEGLVADTSDRRYTDEIATPEPTPKTVKTAHMAEDKGLPLPLPTPEPGGPPVAAFRGSVEDLPSPDMEKVQSPQPLPERISKDMAKDEAVPAPLEKFDASRSGVSAQVGLIRFGNGSAILSESNHRQLKKIAESQKKNGGTLRVIGFASSWTGDMDPLKHQLINFNVSVRRANSVAGALMKYGVVAKDLYVGAKSDSEPIYLEVMPAGEAGNRRAEVYIDY